MVRKEGGREGGREVGREEGREDVPGFPQLLASLQHALAHSLLHQHYRSLHIPPFLSPFLPPFLPPSPLEAGVDDMRVGEGIGEGELCFLHCVKEGKAGASVSSFSVDGEEEIEGGEVGGLLHLDHHLRGGREGGRGELV